jgi:hypothetical protein
VFKLVRFLTLIAKLWCYRQRDTAVNFTAIGSLAKCPSHCGPLQRSTLYSRVKSLQRVLLTLSNLMDSTTVVWLKKSKALYKVGHCIDLTIIASLVKRAYRNWVTELEFTTDKSLVKCSIHDEPFVTDSTSHSASKTPLRRWHNAKDFTTMASMVKCLPDDLQLPQQPIITAMTTRATISTVVEPLLKILL